MVSKRSLRIKSASVLKKLKKRIGSKPKNSVGVQGINLKQAAANNQIDTASEHKTKRSSTSENKQKENRSSEILTRKSKNVADQEDSRVKSCTVLAVKLKYPYVSRTTSVKLNSRSPNKNSNSSEALPRTTVNSPETDLDEQGTSRKSSRVRKPITKELKSALISTDDTKLELEKHNAEASPQKLRNRSVKPQISNDVSSPDQKAQEVKVAPSGKKEKDDMECVRCGLTPSQFFGRDGEHNTICCICSLVNPPQELKALLQLLKLDCCLNFLNQKNRNALKNNNATSRKRRLSGHTSKTDHENATSNSNSDMKTLREKNTVRTQKEQHNQNSPEEQKQSTSQFTRPVRQQKGNSSLNLSKLSNAAKSPNSAVVTSTRISTRLTQKAFPRIKPPTKANKQTPSTIKDIHKRKISPRTTQNPSKRRKFTETVEVKKKDREHICSSCNSTFAMQWKLKLHELTHTDRSCPNVVLRHAEIGKTPDVTIIERVCSEAMVCIADNENVVDKDSLNEQVSDPAVQHINTNPEKLQEDKTISDNENSKEDGDELEHSQAIKQGNEVKSTVDHNEEIVNKDNNDTQNTEITEAKICDAPANKENTEVNQKSNGPDSCDVTTNYDTPSDKGNDEDNEESDVPTCDENPTFNDSTDQSNKTKEDEIGKKPDLSSNFDTDSLSTQDHMKDKEQDEIKPPSETAKSEEPEENENVMEKGKPIDTVSDEDTALDQSEVQNTVKGLGEVEENENNEKSEESVKAIEETGTNELSKTNEDEHVGEENEEGSSEICGNTAGDEMHEDDEVDESSKMDENCCKENTSLKSSSDHCEQKDESLVIEKESNSENTANECSEVGKPESKPKYNHEEEQKADVSENIEKKVNGTVSNDADDEDDGDDGDDGSKNALESEVVVNHPADNTSQHPVDENMADLYNQMNIMFEGGPNEAKMAKAETEKKSSDHHGNVGHSSESNDQKK